MSTHLAPFGLKTIPTSAGLALDTLEWSGPALFVSQTSSARRWKASPGLVSSPSTNHRLANPVISDDLWVVFNSLSFSNNFELKSHVVRSTVGELLTWWIRSRTICKVIISVTVCLRRSLNGGRSIDIHIVADLQTVYNKLLNIFIWLCLFVQQWAYVSWEGRFKVKFFCESRQA